MEFNIPPVQTTPYESPLNSMGSTILLLTDPTNVLREFELDLHGAIEVDNKIIPIAPPLCNEIGVKRILGIVKSLNNQGGIMSKYNEDNKFKTLERTMDALIINLQNHSKEYDIKDTATATWIVTTAFNYTEAAVNRALDQGERGFWKGSQQDIRHIVGSPTENKGKMGKFFNWRGR